MLRRTPLKRGRFRKKPPKPTDNIAHLRYLHTLPCCLGHLYACSDGVQAHHSTVNKGMSLRTSDLDAFPLCAKHHRAFHDHAGFFAGWTKEARKQWQLERSAEYRPREETG